MEAQLARFESVLASQHGLVTLDQLRDGQVSEGQTQRLVHQRVLRRLSPRVFGVVGARDSWERGLLAVVLSLQGSVASHASAARLWKFEPRPEDSYEVTAGREYRAPMRGVVLHR